MSNLSANVTWREIVSESEAGNIPHSRAIAAPSAYHSEIVETLSRIILGSYRPSHPDLLVIGTPDKPPAIGDPEKSNYEGTCRWLIENIALKPFESAKRFAVVECADQLNKSAANSLLKLTEEPPQYAYLLYLMEDGKLFLPTLRSRSRFSTITTEDSIAPKEIPLDMAEWSAWFASARKSTSDNDTITPELESWSEYALETGNVDLSARIDKLRIISSRGNLSVPMLCDIIMLALMEGNIDIEYILDDIR